MTRAGRGAGIRTGATSGATIIGLNELRRELRKLENPRDWTKELTGVHRTIAKEVARWSQSEASGMGGVQAHFASAIRGYASVSGARVGVLGRNGANMAFWGGKKRTGWYSAGKYAGSSGQQHPRWVGNSWDVAVFGQGPYAINDTLAAHMYQIIDRYAKGIGDLTSRAFPD